MSGPHYRLARRPWAPGGGTLSQRAPDNELFDSCCDLAAATHHVRQAAADPESVAALAATLGCLDKSLLQLAEGVEALQTLVALAGASTGQPGAREVTEAVQLLTSTKAQLVLAASSLDGARARVGPLLDD